jgi:hypothetical protein
MSQMPFQAVTLAHCSVSQFAIQPHNNACSHTQAKPVRGFLYEDLLYRTQRTYCLKTTQQLHRA